jgi:hypothetical protein
MFEKFNQAQATWTCPSCEKNPSKATMVEDANDLSANRSLESPTKKPKMLQGKRKKDAETNEKARKFIENHSHPL